MRKLVVALAFLVPAAVQAQGNLATATFAGGCFWCLEEAFEKVPGVVSAVSGYTDGRMKNPSYEMVSSGTTGHTEAVEVKFDPAKVSYEKLLDAFWLNHDPTVIDRQFCDGGTQYRPGIYWHDEEQKRLAHRQGDAVLAGRGVPPGLLQEKSRALQLLLQRLRALQPAERTLG